MTLRGSLAQPEADTFLQALDHDATDDPDRGSANGLADPAPALDVP